MSLYDQANVFSFEGDKYERLTNHPEGHKYRKIFDDDDYDYVECPVLIAVLDNY